MAFNLSVIAQELNSAIAKANAASPQATTYTKNETNALLAEKADLVDGKVPSSQLPSYVDDVLEYAGTSAFPVTGESGKIYVATDTNKTYRWGGSAYVEISESLALGETASTAYPGNNGKANADAIAAMKDGHGIDSFGDVETALAGKADASHTHTRSQITDLGAAAAKGFDASPTSGHTDYAVSSDGVYQALAAKLNTADVDTALSSTSTNPVQNKAVQAPIASLVDRGAKNLLKVTATSQTITGVTFTVNDGSIAVNGKNTGESTALFTICETTLSPNIYRLLGCPGGGSFDSYYLGSLYTDNWAAFLTDTGTGESGQLNASKTIRFRIGVRPGVTVSNLVFKPMLCTAEDYAISPEFVPYAPSNRELYEMILALQSGT